jgi:LuxR family maltose regulon positive regulatory protein
MAQLLYQAAEQGIFQEDTGRLLAALPAEKQRITPTPEASIAQSHTPMTVEPLTKRELEVMQLIATGATNAEIAQELYIAVGTVKNHAKNIYGKLGVHSRSQAIARARGLGLID